MGVRRGEVGVRQAEESKAQVKGSRAQWGTLGHHSCSCSSGTPHHSTASPGRGGREPAAATSYSVTVSSSDLGGKSTGFVPAGDLQEERIGAVVKTVERCLSILALLLPQTSSRARLKQRVHTQLLTVSSSFLASQTHALGLGNLQGSRTLPPSAKVNQNWPLNIEVDLFSECSERLGPSILKRPP